MIDIFGNGYTINKLPKGVITYPTGFGEEVYFYDKSGYTYHVPSRTKSSHPYNYDPITFFQNGDEDQVYVYSDRMQQWDYEKFNKAIEGKGEMAFRWADKEAVTQFMRSYYDDVGLTVCSVVEMCNASSGYPLWLIGYKPNQHNLIL